MTQPQRIGDLDLEQDLSFHRRELRAERVGWGLMLLVVVAALLGLFGSGPLSWGQTQSADGQLEVEYDRFARDLAPTELRLTLHPDPAQGEEVRVWLSRDFLQRVQLQQITPEPQSVETGPGRLTYTFPAAPAGSPVRVVFRGQTQGSGLLRGNAGLPGTAAEVRFSTFIYP